MVKFVSSIKDNIFDTFYSDISGIEQQDIMPSWETIFNHAMPSIDESLKTLRKTGGITDAITSSGTETPQSIIPDVGVYAQSSNSADASIEDGSMGKQPYYVLNNGEITHAWSNDELIGEPAESTNKYDPIVYHDPTNAKPYVVKLSDAQLDPQGNKWHSITNYVNAYLYDGIRIPIIHLNNIVLDNANIESFSLFCGGMTPSIYLTVVDTTPKNNLRVHAGLNNKLVVILMPGADGKYRSIKLEFYITDIQEDITKESFTITGVYKNFKFDNSNLNQSIITWKGCNGHKCNSSNNNYEAVIDETNDVNIENKVDASDEASQETSLTEETNETKSSTSSNFTSQVVESAMNSTEVSPTSNTTNVTDTETYSQTLENLNVNELTNSNEIKFSTSDDVFKLAKQVNINSAEDVWNKYISADINQEQATGLIIVYLYRENRISDLRMTFYVALINSDTFRGRDEAETIVTNYLKSILGSSSKSERVRQIAAKAKTTLNQLSKTQIGIDKDDIIIDFINWYDLHIWKGVPDANQKGGAQYNSGVLNKQVSDGTIFNNANILQNFKAWHNTNNFSNTSLFDDSLEEDINSYNPDTMNMWEVCHEIAKECGLGFAAMDECKSSKTPVNRMIGKRSYRKYLQDTLKIAGADENEVYDAWIDFHGYLVLVNLATALNAPIESNEVSMYAETGIKGEEVLMDLDKEFHEVTRIITNHNMLGSNSNVLIEEWYMNSNVKKLRDNGSLVTNFYWSPLDVGGNNALIPHQVRIVENSKDGAVTEDYEINNYTGWVCCMPQPGTQYINVGTKTAKENYQLYQQSAIVKAFKIKHGTQYLTVRLNTPNMALERGMIINVVIEQYNTKNKLTIAKNQGIIYEENNPLSFKPADNGGAIHNLTEDDVLYNDGIGIVDPDLSGMFYIDCVRFDYFKGDEKLSQYLYLIKRGALTSVYGNHETYNKLQNVSWDLTGDNLVADSIGDPTADNVMNVT